ncbi:MAG TPA: hypothetical protein VFJ29_04890 [Candidatus Kapabacteria bacterium]|nr:hypothetical protein [Candidatus Kapabacteria bacterium]
MDFITIIIYAGLALFMLWIKTSIKSTVEYSVKHEFDVRLQEIQLNFNKEAEARERKDKFRLAALDERLKVHQEAYALSVKFGSLLFNKDQRVNLLQECQKFWNLNCLYLSTSARNAFSKAYVEYMNYELYLVTWKESKTHTNQLILERAFNHIRSTPLLIAQSIDLESMGEGGSIEVLKKDFSGAAI